MGHYDRERNVSDLVGVTLLSITVMDEKDRINFVSTDGRSWSMFHDQDCCESVSIEEIHGDLSDLIGTPILMAEESTSKEDPEGYIPDDYGRNDSFTWTFYRFVTIKGSVQIRWLGESNGYYSESVSLYEDEKIK